MATSEWAETASADNATATAERAAEAGREHHMTTVVASYEATKEGLLTVTSGGEELIRVEVFDEVVIPFPHPVRGGEGKPLTASLTPSGTGGTNGFVTLIGFTI